MAKDKEHKMTLKQKMEEMSATIVEPDTMNAGEGGMSFAQLVMIQCSKCHQENNKEMTRGGKMSRLVDGELIESIVPDQIEIFVNTVESLGIMLNKRITTLKKADRDTIPDFVSIKKKLVDWKNKSFDKIREKVLKMPNRVSPLTGVNYRAQATQKSFILIDKINSVYDEKLLNLYARPYLQALSDILDLLNYMRDRD